MTRLLAVVEGQSEELFLKLPGFDKIEHGVPACELIRLEKLRACCPRFGAWIEQLENL